MIPADPDLLRAGYVAGPCAPCFVHGLEDIAADLEAAGARVIWADTPEAARCYLWQRVIVLGSWLLRRPRYQLRAALAHEAAHLLCSRSEDRACAWMRQRYGDATDPPEWMA